MKVKAINPGYYDMRRIKVGEILEVPEKYFSDKWMEKVEERLGRVSGGSKAKVSKVVEAVEPEPDAGDDEVI